MGSIGQFVEVPISLARFAANLATTPLRLDSSYLVPTRIVADGEHASIESKIEGSELQYFLVYRLADEPHVPVGVDWSRAPLLEFSTELDTDELNGDEFGAGERLYPFDASAPEKSLASMLQLLAVRSRPPGDSQEDWFDTFR